MTTIPLSQVISRAKVQTRESSAAKDLDYEIFAVEAMVNLRCLSSFAELTEEVDVINGSAKLPCGTASFLGATPYDNENCCTCGDLYYVNFPFLTSCGCPILPYYRDCGEIFRILNGYVHLHQPTDIAKLQITYMGIPKDDEGLPVIDQRYEQALMHYICFMDSLQPGTKLTPRQADKHERLWVAQQAMLAGDDTVNSWNLNKHWVMGTIMSRVQISEKM